MDNSKTTKNVVAIPSRNLDVPGTCYPEFVRFKSPSRRFRIPFGTRVHGNRVQTCNITNTVLTIYTSRKKKNKNENKNEHPTDEYHYPFIRRTPRDNATCLCIRIRPTSRDVSSAILLRIV